jgi:DNA-binding NarL/FixJ family response regulator
MAGDIYLSSQIANLLIKDYLIQSAKDDSSPFKSLTAREREILQLLAEGNSTKQIASILFISMKTVETHRRQLMEKLNIRTIAGLTKYAISEGLTSLDI